MQWWSKWAIGLATLVAAMPATASTGRFFMPQRPVAAPNGFVAMCAAQPDACNDVRVDSTLVSSDLEKLLRHVNRLVNRHVRQVSDAARFVRNDVWQASGIGRGATGDCEDIALEKRKLLVEAGVSPDRLFLAVAYGRGRGGLHLVLIARTDDGDVVLDSRSATIMPWSNAPYTWIAIQSADQPRLWFSV